MNDAHQRYFASNCYFGLDVSLAASPSTIKETLDKWKLGSVVFALTVAHRLLTLKPFNAVIQNDSDARVFYDV
ncbi:hypothetical protein [Sporosarcina ureae]|uniref:hypothetical protein n=1 Tax=Sporosarcina ureae TaxID=1571 RepID=UPI0028AA2DC2|nr:hypothetical protein [Sporosarcina ureae]